MKKEYTNPIIEIIDINTTDVITTSGTDSFDPLSILNDDSAHNWFS